MLSKIELELMNPIMLQYTCSQKQALYFLLLKKNKYNLMQF